MCIRDRSKGAFDKAIDILRKKGQKIAAKRADRSASEGVVISSVNSARNLGIIVSLNCETDFVAKNEDFIKLANSILELSIKNETTTLDELNSLEFTNGKSVEDNRELFYKKDMGILARGGFSFELSKRVLDLEKTEFNKLIKII